MFMGNPARFAKYLQIIGKSKIEARMIHLAVRVGYAFVLIGMR